MPARLMMVPAIAGHFGLRLAANMQKANGTKKRSMMMSVPRLVFPPRWDMSPRMKLMIGKSDTITIEMMNPVTPRGLRCFCSLFSILYIVFKIIA